MSNSINALDTNYLLKSGEAEKARLDRRYPYLQKVFGRTMAAPSEIDLSKITHVMDVGAGSLRWILDFASTPEIKARLHSNDRPLTLYASDITDGNFPSTEILRAHRINTFLHDVTKPFPDELVGKFELVQVSSLVVALSAEGWKKAMKHISDLLKPGGYLLLRDGDTYWYPEPSLVPTKSLVHDTQNAVSGTSHVHKVNAIFHKAATANGFIPNLSSMLPSVLDLVNLRVLYVKPAVCPWGKYCELWKGLGGDALKEDFEFTVESITLTLNTITQGQLQAGILEAPLGVPVTTEAERLQLVQEMVKGIKEQGMLNMMFESLIRKAEV